MRKHKVLVPVLCVLLIAALAVSGVIVLSNSTTTTLNNGPSYTGGLNETTDDSRASLSNAQVDEMFVIDGNGRSNINGLFEIKDGSGKSVEASVSKSGKNFVVKAVNGFTAGGSYVIKLLDSSISFVDYPSYNSVLFMIEKDDVSNYKLNGDVTRIANGDIVSLNDAQLVLLDKYAIENADILVVNDEENCITNAYKATEVVSKGEYLYVTYVIPEIDEVYEELDVYTNGVSIGETDLNVADADALAMEVAAPLLSDLALANLPTPEVSVDFNMDNLFTEGYIDFTVTVTVNDLVSDWRASSSLVFTIANRISVDLVYSMSKDITNTFRLGSIVEIDTETSLKITVSDSNDIQQNMEDLIQKIGSYFDEDYAVNAKIFTGILPIGSTGLSVNYDIDAVFRYSFVGDLGVTLKSSVRLESGITAVNGKIDSYAIIDGGIDNIGVDVYGTLQTKAGIIQTLGLSLINIVDVGIQVELGGYNDLYGWLLADVDFDEDWNADVMCDGAYYIEGGFYYDVKLAYGIDIPGLVTIGDALSLAGGKIPFYSLGEKEFDYKMVDNNKVFNLSSYEAELPVYSVNRYNLITRSFTAVELSSDQITVELQENSALTLNGNVISVSAEEGVVEEVITVSYFDGKDTVSTQTTIIKESGVPMLDANYFAYDKLESNPVVIKPDMFTAEFKGITGAGISSRDYDYVDGKLTIKEEFLKRLSEGSYTFSFNTGVNSIEFTVYVTGKLSYDSSLANGVYQLFSADQIISMIEASASTDFAEMKFSLMNDIDMGVYLNGELTSGKVGSIAVFSGALIGNGYSISNMTVESNLISSDKQTVGFIGVNNGAVSAIDFINVNIYSNVDKGSVGIIGVNNGIVDSVTFEGSIINRSRAEVDVKIGGIAGTNNGKIIRAVVSASIKNINQLDIPGVVLSMGAIAGGANGIISECKFSGSIISEVETGTNIIVKPDINEIVQM